MQETILIGNITQDAQIKDWNGSQFIAFSVADNETYTDSDGVKHERTTYWSCLKPVFNGNTKVAPFLTKGTLVYLRGRVSSKVYEKEGKWYGGLNLRVDDLKLLSGNIPVIIKPDLAHGHAFFMGEEIGDTVNVNGFSGFQAIFRVNAGGKVCEAEFLRKLLAF